MAINTGAIPKRKGDESKKAKRRTTGQSGAPVPVAVDKSNQRGKKEEKRGKSQQPQGGKYIDEVSRELVVEILQDFDMSGEEEDRVVLAPPNTPQHDIREEDIYTQGDTTEDEAVEVSDGESTEQDTIIEKIAAAPAAKRLRDDDSYERLFAGNRTKAKVHSTPEHRGSSRNGSEVQGASWFVPSLTEDEKIINEWVATGSSQVKEAW